MSHRSLRAMGALSALGAAALAAALTSCGGGGSPSVGGLVSLDTTSVPPASTGVPYTTQMVASFPNSPGSYLLTGGALPTGLVLDHATGVISGYPRQVGAFHFEIAARDGTDLTLPPGRDENYAEDRQNFTINVALGEPNILPQIPPAAQYRASYGYQIDIAGGTAPFTFAQTGGTLPAGISVSSSGFVGNFPTQAQAAPYTFQVTVTDAHGLQDTETLALQVVVLPLLIFTSSPLPQAASGFPFDIPLTLASIGGGAPIVWTQVPPVAGEVLLSAIGLQITGLGHIADLGAGVTAPPGTYLFTIKVTDEPLQVATRQYSITVNPGPVLTLINPKSSAVPGPYTVTGLNFQPGMQVIFKPGPTQTIVLPTFINPTTVTFNSPVPKPSNGNGAVPVMVKNPDGGAFTKNAAFTFPATTLAFGTKGFFTSTLSSTGLDCADVNSDGFADIVHCGSSGQTVYSGSPTSTAAGLLFHKNLATSPPTFSTVTLDSASYYDCKFADVNTDGKLDVVGLLASQIKVFLGNGDGTFGSAITSTQPGGYSWPSEMTIGKFNSDAIPDLAFCVSNWPSANTNGRVYTMVGNGTGGFTTADSAVTTMPVVYGVISLAAADTDGDGRDEIMAGTGMENYQTPMISYAATSATGTFTGWSYRGPTIATPYYASATGVIAGDFLGIGSKQVFVAFSGSTYSVAQVAYLYSGSGFNTNAALTSPTARAKCCAVVDGDFDTKMECAVTETTSTIQVYRGSNAAVLTLDAGSGSPSISSPQVGRIASGDLDNDGAPDIVATTSYWQTNGMAANYGSSYTMANTGNGGQMGIVFFLNTSN